MDHANKKYEKTSIPDYEIGSYGGVSTICTFLGEVIQCTEERCFAYLANLSRDDMFH